MDRTVTKIDRERSKLSRLARMRWHQLSLLAEAVAILAIVRLIVAARTPARLSLLLGRPSMDDDVTPESALRAGDTERAALVSWGIRCAGTHVPFRAMCFEQALAARMMLDRRAIPATIHYGIAPSSGNGGLRAHVWTDAAGLPITGYPLRSAFREIARFASARLKDTQHHAG